LHSHSTRLSLSIIQWVPTLSLSLFIIYLSSFLFLSFSLSLPLLSVFLFWCGDVSVQTPLHHAVREGRTEAVELLLDAGADVTARNVHRNYFGLGDRKENEDELEYVFLSLWMGISSCLTYFVANCKSLDFLNSVYG
jgi:hypothetical protein